MRLPQLKPWQTAALVILIGLGAIAFLLLGWGVVEALTLADDVEGNHITAVFRELWAKQPGAILLTLLIVSNALSHFFGWLGGHLFWCK